jgi:uncharacterized protein YecT (DUF1311 family)
VAEGARRAPLQHLRAGLFRELDRGALAWIPALFILPMAIVQQRSHATRPLASSSAIRIALCAVIYAAASPAAAQTEKWVPDDQSCGEGTTLDIVACLEARTAIWDKRLNQAYQALTKMLASMPEGDAAKKQVAQLKTAQRLWLQYRSANCTFHALGQGTIRQIDAAECMRRMTQDRAIELQEAGPQ